MNVKAAETRSKGRQRHADAIAKINQGMVPPAPSVVTDDVAQRQREAREAHYAAVRALTGADKPYVSPEEEMRLKAERDAQQALDEKAVAAEREYAAEHAEQLDRDRTLAAEFAKLSREARAALRLADKLEQRDPDASRLFVAFAKALEAEPTTITADGEPVAHARLFRRFVRGS